jgi:hypothetical protein
VSKQSLSISRKSRETTLHHYVRILEVAEPQLPNQLQWVVIKRVRSKLSIPVIYCNFELDTLALDPKYIGPVIIVGVEAEVINDVELTLSPHESLSLLKKLWWNPVNNVDLVQSIVIGNFSYCEPNYSFDADDVIARGLQLFEDQIEDGLQNLRRLTFVMSDDGEGRLCTKCHKNHITP